MRKQTCVFFCIVLFRNKNIKIHSIIYKYLYKAYVPLLHNKNFPKMSMNVCQCSKMIDLWSNGRVAGSSPGFEMAGHITEITDDHQIWVFVVYSLTDLRATIIPGACGVSVVRLSHTYTYEYNSWCMWCVTVSQIEK